MNPNSRLLLTTLVLLALTAAAGCRGTSNADARAAEEEAGFRTLLRGYHSGIAKRGVRLARDDEEWQALWKEHTAIMLPRPTAPDVDFSRESVVGAFLGERGTAGYGLEIRGLRREGDELTVDALETKPAADLIVPQVVTHPYHFVVVPKLDEGQAVLELR